MILVKPSHKIEFLQLDSLKMIEKAGRTCYKTEDKVTNGSSEKFVAMIMKSGHHSVIEHANMSVRLICDRGVTHEIVRHRLCSYSQESTRYCNYSGGVTFIIPPWLNIKQGLYQLTDINTLHLDTGGDRWFRAMEESERNYRALLGSGWTPQQARSILPNSLKTEIVCTTNFREWRHILKLRCSKAAHPQMQELMIPLLDEVKKQVPIIFDDL